MHILNYNYTYSHRIASLDSSKNTKNKTKNTKKQRITK